MTELTKGQLWGSAAKAAEFVHQRVSFTDDELIKLCDCDRKQILVIDVGLLRESIHEVAAETEARSLFLRALETASTHRSCEESRDSLPSPLVPDAGRKRAKKGPAK